MKSNDLENRVVEGLLEGLLSAEPQIGPDELEQRASIGCSVSARALVNARETLVELTQAVGVDAEPSASLRERVLTSTKPATERDAQVEAPGPVEDPRSVVPDSSERVAQLHIESEDTGRDEADRARRREVQALGAHESRDDDRFDRVLAELSLLLPYRVFLIAVLHGEWVHHRATHGVPEALGDFRRVSRIGTFCTHCVSSGRPFRVENAATEPFFRGNRMVWEYGARAYAGAPLRSSKGIVFGTVCALHDEPRSVPPTHLAVLAHFARRVVAEMERLRDPRGLEQIVDSVVQTPAGPKEIVTEVWFRTLLERLLDLQAVAEDHAVAEDGRALAQDGPSRFSLEMVAEDRFSIDRWSTLPKGTIVARMTGDEGYLAQLTPQAGDGVATSSSAVSSADQPGAADWLGAARRQSV